MLKQLIYSDLARQCELEGRPRHPGLWLLLLRMFHHRFLPLVLCRLSRAFFLAGFSPLAHLCTYLNIVLFGIEVTPRCAIGKGLFFPHTSGIVIGAASIGDNAIIFQGVTLGAKAVDLNFSEATRPRLGNNVTVGAGAKILGGIELGDNVSVGANAVVVHSAATGAVLVGVPAHAVYACETR